MGNIMDNLPKNTRLDYEPGYISFLCYDQAKYDSFDLWKERMLRYSYNTASASEKRKEERGKRKIVQILYIYSSKLRLVVIVHNCSGFSPVKK